MSVNLYASLAAQQQLDSAQAVEVSQLAALSSMLASISHSTASSYDDFTSAAWAMLNGSNKDADNGGACPATATNVAFDSPLDQSLGSPASTRDFQQSPLQDYEFDFSTSMDAPLFPDHGTQQTQNDNLLSGLPLFGTELSLSQPIVANRSATLTTPSQQQSSITAAVETAACSIDDFSFDAITRNMAEYTDMGHASFKAINNVDQDTINAAATDVARAYARTHAIQDIDVLLHGLREAGIDVSDETVSELLAPASFGESRSPSPSMSQDAISPVASNYGRSTSTSLSPSAMSSSTGHVGHHDNKSRSSIQLGPKGSLHASASQHARRFTCETCHKNFDRFFNMRTHALTHVLPEDRDKPYACPWSQCSKPFIRKYDAERHYRSVHVKRGEHASAEEIEKAFSGEHGIPAPSSLSHAEVNQANG